MNWFFIALIAPALWSATNHIDKYLVSKYFKDAGITTLMIFSSLSWASIALAILIFKPDVLSVPLATAFLMLMNGIVYLLAIFPYLMALKRDEASIVVPLFQLMPVMVYVLSFVALGETLTLQQIVASLIIIFGAVLLSFELGDEKIRLKMDVLGLMTLSSFLFAFNFVFFKFFALEQTFWTTQFWQMIGQVLIGALMLIFLTQHRKNFVALLKVNKLPILGLNMSNELINISAVLAFGYASLLAPVALVQTVNGFQAFFVFLFGVLITLLVPAVGVESLARKHLVQKIVSIAILLTGTFLLFQ